MRSAPNTGRRHGGQASTLAPHPAGVPSLQLDAVTAAYDDQVAITGVSFALTRGERVAVIGPNGAGKSTLFRVIAGLHKPISGRVAIYGDEPGRHVCIAYIEQHSSIQWSFPLTVRDAVGMGRVARLGYFRRPGQADRLRVDEALVRLSIQGLAERRVGELSDGQKQRMLIARALVQEAEIMLLDEPLSGLDARAQDLLADALDVVGDAVTVMLATHHLPAAERLGRVLLLNRRVVALGDPTDVFTEEHLTSAYGPGLSSLASMRMSPAQGVVRA